MDQKTKRLSHLIISITYAAFITLFLYGASHTKFYKGIRYESSDFKERHAYNPDRAGRNTVIVAIDDVSLKKFSESYNYNWPLPRQFYGIVLDYLNKAGVDVVIYDILFNDHEVGRTDINSKDSEAFFEAALKRYGKTVLGGTLGTSLMPDQFEPKHLALTGENFTKIPGKIHPSVILPIKLFSENSQSGIVTFHQDEDGVCRRLPLIFKAGDSYYPQLAFAAYLKVTNDRVVKYDAVNQLLITEKRKFQLDKDGYKQIVWNGPGGGLKKSPYPYVSFFDLFISGTQLMTGEKPLIPLSEFKNKKVVICASAQGLMDLKPTPFTSMGPYPGGEIHATLLDNLLQDREVKTIPGLFLALFTVVLLTFLNCLFIRQALYIALPVAILAITIVLASSFSLYYYNALDFPYLFIIIAIVLSSAAVSMHKMLTEGTQKRQIRTIFSRYLHEDVINILMQEPDKVDLEGTELMGTVLFTDLQGFTTFAEDKTPQQLIDVLNRYFQVVTDIVLDNEGMLDKYTGDGIMAIFGAPIEKKDHAKAACEVILSFREHHVNELISSEEGNILTRIGISSGPIVVGNLGSSRRMDFTAIGDTVNLSARLEGVNKAYGTTNIMSEYTWEYVKDDYFFRELDFIRVKGKNKPIRVFTLIDRKDAATESQQAIENMFSKGITAYRNRQWGDAVGLFKQVLELNPDDSPATAYIERCKLLKTTPELVDSQGVFTFKTK